MKYIFMFCMAILSTQVVRAQNPEPLYEGKIPNYIAGNNEQSQTNTNGIVRVSKVSEPSYRFFKAPGDGPKPCVIICPGGGYHMLAASHEGSDVAKKLNENGINALVLYYRLPDSTRQQDKSIAPLQDAQQAIRLVRKNAALWNVDPNKTGIMGFSAGGHLASTAATHFDKDYLNLNDGINIRPDFQILIYPVISFRSPYGHKGSANKLLGAKLTESNRALFSNEEQITARTPPAFLVHSADDKTVNLKNSLIYAEKLTELGIPADLHVYAKGGHGYGMNNKTTEDEWFESLVEWFKSSGIL